MFRLEVTRNLPLKKLDAENGGMCPVLRVGAKRCAWQSSMAAPDVADIQRPSSERRMAEANLRSPLFRPSEETR